MDLLFGVPELSEEPLAHAEYAQKLAEDGIAAFEHVRENLSAAFKRQKKYYDLVGKVKDAFPEGQLCWYYDPVKKKGRSPKLQSPWRGPVKGCGSELRHSAVCCGQLQGTFSQYPCGQAQALHWRERPCVVAASRPVLECLCGCRKGVLERPLSFLAPQ